MTKIIENQTFVDFGEKNTERDKDHDHCHSTGKYRGPAHNKVNNNVTQKLCYFMHFLFHNFSRYDCHLFLKKLVHKKNNKVKLDITPKTKEACISKTYGCFRYIDRY